MKTKKDTPKYGLIYHSALVGQASTKNKGKISRSLAAKASLATRVDAFGEEATFDMGTNHRARLETRLRILEEGNFKKLSGTGKVKAKFEKYQNKSEIKLYPTEEDNTIPIKMEKKRKFSEGKKLIEEIKTEEDDDEAGPSEPPQKKKKKNKQATLDETQTADDTMEETPKKKKKIKHEDESMNVDEPEAEAETPKSDKKKKKKKPKQEAEDED